MPDRLAGARRDKHAGLLVRERPRLVGIGYRMLGSVADAEDVVQETYARWYALPVERQQQIANPSAWLTTVATRVSLDVLRSARVRRERYVGEWIPEPLPHDVELSIGAAPDGFADPADHVSLDESLSMAILVVLQSMTPAERVSFILHDVFQYPFADIARIVGRSPAACRQLATSARRRIHAQQPSLTPPAEQAAIVGRFRRAWAAGDIDALVSLLDPDVKATADGGGVRSAVRPARGSLAVAQTLLLAADLSSPALRVVERTVNGRPGLVVQQDGITVTVMAFEVRQGRITRLWGIRDPQKLRLWEAHPGVMALR